MPRRKRLPKPPDPPRFQVGETVTFRKHDHITSGTCGEVEQVNREPLYYSVRVVLPDSIVHVNATEDQLSPDSP